MELGFYGKLPSHGDFLRRRVSDGFVGVWDAWLQECIANSRADLGDRWLDVYLTSPAWRFACAGGTCGAAPVIGLMVPSVDRVGRYFPLTLVAELPEEASLIVAANATASFFENAERLVIETLEAEHVSFDAFDDRVVQLGNDLAAIQMSPTLTLEMSAAAILGDATPPQWQIPLGATGNLAPAFEQLLTARLTALYDPLVLWWTAGSSIVEPSCLIARGLPHPDTFASLLDGSWAGRQWQSVAVQTSAISVHDETLVPDLAPPRFRSAGSSNVGRVREINQDSFVERPEAGLWAVADGMGGHTDGEVASRMVCDALADFTPSASFEDMIETTRQRIDQVNDHLHRSATRPVNPVHSGSTVVALLARGSRCAVLWAGDSRVYRWRDGQLEQLTRDHSVENLDGLIGGEESHAITRAVGGESTLTLDVFRDRVRPGDRFLLCSDGLTRSVPEVRIRTWLERESVAEVVDGLIKATLDAGAPDNVTVLVVESYA